MEIAFAKMAAAFAPPGPGYQPYTYPDGTVTPFCYGGIVFELNKTVTQYFNIERSLVARPLKCGHPDAPQPGEGEKEAWYLPSVSTVAGGIAYDQKPVAGADCATLANFEANVCMIMGIPGNFDAKTYYALNSTQVSSTRPLKAVEGDLRHPIRNPPSGDPSLNSSWELYFCAATPSLGATTGLNAFEGVLVYQDPKGRRFYVAAGGQHHVFADIDPNVSIADSHVHRVVQIFSSLAWWGDFDDDNNANTPPIKKVMAIDWPYVAPPNDNNPCP